MKMIKWKTDNFCTFCDHLFPIFSSSPLDIFCHDHSKVFFSVIGKIIVHLNVPREQGFWREEQICTQILDKGFYSKTFRGNRKEWTVTLLGLKLMTTFSFPSTLEGISLKFLGREQ